MRVLVTNNRLEYRGGAESFVRDLARDLQAAGHSVVAYSSDPGQGERLLENDLIPVSTDLEHLPFRPDVIHAQHHLDAMTAILALPGVPALYHCHGAIWREWAPRHPRIYRYVAVSRTLAERMAIEANIPPANISVVQNGVDLARFSRVRTLPVRAARALFFNGRHGEQSETFVAVRDAASRLGLALDTLGMRFGRMVPDPEHVLPDYDIVFASGRSAIEALACGCAVVILGRTSCGPLVRRDNYDHFRQVNFAIAVNSPPPSADRIAEELAAYSAEDGAAVTVRLRHDADGRRVASTLVGLYEDVIARHRLAPADADEEVRAAARYLRRLVPLIKMTDVMLGGQWSSPSRASSFVELRAELELLQQRIKHAQ